MIHEDFPSGFKGYCQISMIGYKFDTILLYVSSLSYIINGHATQCFPTFNFWIFLHNGDTITFLKLQTLAEHCNFHIKQG